MKIVFIVLGILAYLFVAFLYGIMGPTASIEGGNNDQHWWEAWLWPIGIIYRALGGT